MRHWLLTGFLLCLLGCGAQTDEPRIGLLAPRSLQPVLEPVVAGWELSHGQSVRIGFDPPERLLRQANGGTPAHVFVSADLRWMDALVSDGHVNEQDRCPVAHDPLVFVSTTRRPLIRDPQELISDSGSIIGLMTPDLPAGALAERALKATGVWTGLAERVVYFRTASHLRDGLEDGTVQAAVTVQSASLLARDTLSTHPFSPDLAFGSTVEVAPLQRRTGEDNEAVDALVAALVDGPDARSGWTRLGLEVLRGPAPHRDGPHPGPRLPDAGPVPSPPPPPPPPHGAAPPAQPTGPSP